MKLKTAVLFGALFLLSMILIHTPKSLAAKKAIRKDMTGGGMAPRAALATTAPDPAAKARIAEAYGKLPLSFEANRGQADAAVQFLSRGRGFTLSLTSNEAVFSLRKANPGGGRTFGPVGAPALPQAVTHARVSGGASEGAAVVRMKLAGANPNAHVSGVDELPGTSNYFIGNDPRNWRTNISTYGKVRYEDIYPGVDLVYYGNQGQLEYDFVVAPGANPKAIRLAVEGQEKLRLDGQGDLVLQTHGGELRLHQPVVYQEIGGVRKEVAGNFALQGQRQAGFDVARYDTSKPLIIDPTLTYSTYLGTSASDGDLDIAVDSSGNAYLTGFTNCSINSPLTSCGDAFVAKLAADGNSLIYSTTLGGSSDDGAYGIAVDSSGHAYVTGYTCSTDFPTAHPYQTANAALNCGTKDNPDAFVSELAADGASLVYSTYLAGDDYDFGFAIAVDSSGNAYVTGVTLSSNFPTQHPLPADTTNHINAGDYDAFVTKLHFDGSTLSLIYSTFLGGNCIEFGTGIAVDSSGDAYVTGNTCSSNFPTQNAYASSLASNEDAFVSKLHFAGSTLSLAYSTYLGGGSDDAGGRIAVDSSGVAYISGVTLSNDFPTTTGAYQTSFGGGFDDGFMAKLDTTKSGSGSLLYSTYLGGSGAEGTYGIAVDSSGDAYMTGTTCSPGSGSISFPTTANAYQTTNPDSGGCSAFVTRLHPAGGGAYDLVYSTYLGGSSESDGEGLALGSTAGDVYVSGATLATDFPDTTGAYQTANAGHWDAFVTKLSALPGPDFSFSSIAPITDHVGGSATASVTVNSLTAFNSAVGLTVTGQPTGVTASFSSASVTPPANGSISSTLTVNVGSSVTPGSFTLTVTGTSTSPSVTHSAKVMVTVVPVDFSFSSIAPITAPVGGSVPATVTVNSLGAFNSAVSLTVTGQPTGVTASLSASSVTPASNGSISSTLTVNVGASVSPETFTLTVTGTSTSPSLTHSTPANVTVGATTSSTSTVIGAYQAAGCIDNSGISGALTSKLTTAQNDINSGDISGAINTLSALLNELQAQSGKHVMTTCTIGSVTFNPATVLINDVQSILAGLKTTGTANPIVGYVVNSKGAGLSGATVGILGPSPSTTVVATATTDSTGFYFFADTSALTASSNYTAKVTVFPKGFKTSAPASQTFTWGATALTLANFVLN